MDESAFAKASAARGRQRKSAFAEAMADKEKKPGDILCPPASTKLLTKPTWAKPSNQLNLWALYQIIFGYFFYLLLRNQLANVFDIG